RCARPRSATLGAAALLIAGAVLGGGPPVWSQAKKGDDALQAEKRKLEQAEQRLKEERRRAAEAKARESSVLAELEEVEKRLEAKQKEITRLDARIRRVQADVAGLRAEIRQLERSRSGQQELLAARLKAIYRMHAQGGALPLLVGNDPVARSVAIRHLASLATLDARLIQEYRGTTDRLDDRRRREEARQRELASLRSDAQREQLEVDRDAAKRRALLARVRDQRAYHERMVGELTEATRRLEAFVRDLQARQRRLARVPPPRAVPDGARSGFAALRGRLPWPTDGRVVTAFGAQVHPRFGTRTFRNGVDIAAAEGRDVAAVYAGQVVYTGWFKGYGNLVILDHGEDYYTLYAHMADIAVDEGDEVRQGQRIGSVGDTGSLDGPRLYFEVRHQGKPLDPEQWLRERG
ncbi:MAG TPA: peptidoglycan DD-metalloendopeptidase family protein, partial [Candidatus Tectomicrobia bacterium]|nr:peptidoglycan DD-metalloendopeptidase family protein [Candidatus Tectomicrobia bacterium]